MAATKGRKRAPAVAAAVSSAAPTSSPSPDVTPTALMRAASDLVSRAELAGLAGITFGGKRDAYEVLGYKRTLTLGDYDDRYRRDGMAARIIEAYPRATWRGGAVLIEDEDPNVETAFERAFAELDGRLSIWATWLAADILAGKGSYSVILIGAPGPLDTPLESAAPDQISYLQPFSEQNATIATGDSVADPTDQRFGLPFFYTLSGLDTPASNASGTGVARKVHWTRVIHVAEALDDRLRGSPRLERVWNRLDDLEKVIGGGAEAFWQRAHQGYQFDLDPKAKLSPEEKAEFKDQLEEFVHGYRRFIQTKAVDVTTFGSDVANSKPNADAIVDQISAATGIPQRILMGSEQGSLASTQDKDSWDERVSDRRKDFAFGRVVKPSVDRLVTLGVLPMPDVYQVQWPEEKTLTPKERAEVVHVLAQANQANGSEIVTPDELRDLFLDLEPLDTLAPIESSVPADVTQTDTQARAARRRIVKKKPVRRAISLRGLPNLPARVLSIVPRIASSGGSHE